MWHLEGSALGVAFVIAQLENNEQTNNQTKTMYSNDPASGLATVMQWASCREQRAVLLGEGSAKGEQQSPYAESRAAGRLHA